VTSAAPRPDRARPNGRGAPHQGAPLEAAGIGAGGGSRETAHLDLRRASKTFGTVRVLRDVDLETRGGEVRALLGQNGSGKSTLIKILAGYHAPDPGTTLRVGGEEISFPITGDTAGGHGISFVHQDLGLIESMSIVENLTAGRLRRETRLGLSRVRWREERKRAREALSAFGLSVDPDRLIADLGEGDRAIVAIARALATLPRDEPGVLVLDEPTASLPQKEAELLFDVVRQLRDRGYAVVFVSHRLEEVRAIADTATVLRDGALAWSGPLASVDDDALIELIVGTAVQRVAGASGSARTTTPVLSARKLAGAVASEIDFDLHDGEVLGVTGLAGMGQDELPELLLDSGRRRHGEVSLAGGAGSCGSPRAAMRSGIGYLPANRLREGCVPGATVAENVSLSMLGRYYRRGWLDARAERREIGELLRRFDVRPPDPRAPMGTLSGGNQQKALLARLVHLGSRILILHEPTKGVDVAAREQILGLVAGMREKGISVLLISTEYEDLARICDRVLVVRHGAVEAEIERPHLTESAIATACLTSGVEGQAA
jgi:ribose transport system ATP-binding protein